MPIYYVECRMDTYASAEIEAESAEQAMLIAKGLGPEREMADVDWTPATDWDSSTDWKVEEIKG